MRRLEIAGPAPAPTDLVKFLILLRKLIDGYTTLTEVYRYAIDESLIERDLQRGEEMFALKAPAIRIAAYDYHLTLAQSPWPHWNEGPNDQFTHPLNEELEAFLVKRDIAFTIERPVQHANWGDRQEQLAA